AGGAVDSAAVGCAVTHGATRCRREVERDLRDTGTGEVTDVDAVGAAESVEVDMLDAIEVHGDVTDIAREADPPMIGRDVDLFIRAGAVEHHRVGAISAFDRVAAVTRIPDERIVAAAEVREIVASAAGARLLAVPPNHAL